MASVKCFVFNPFQENTYVVSDDTTRECVIIDPGMSNAAEEAELMQYIQNHGLKPVMLLNTHCHVDHIWGNHFVIETFKVPFYAHRNETDNLQRASVYGSLFGIKISPQRLPDHYLTEESIIRFGQTTLHTLYTPGHSPGGVCFHCAADLFVLAGDVLFQQSIGRTDLPGGDYDTLIQSIFTRLLPLPDDTVVYSGHGPATNIGAERRFNPFLR